MSRYFYFILFLFFSGIASAQEDGGSGSKWCRDDIEKKAVSLYEKGTDKKKYKKPERLEFLVGALKINPEFPEANLAMGLELAARCKLENKAFTPTLPFFYKAIAQCPNIHSEPYYYIGYDFYERMANDSAIKYLKKFVDFKDDNEKKFSSDYSGELYQAKEMIKSAKKEMGLKRNVPFSPGVVQGVSTRSDEYLAYVSPDDKYCYFTRTYPRNSMDKVYTSDRMKEVFMVAARDKTGMFSEGEPMSSPFNETEDNQGGCTITIDNKHLYFAMMKQEGGLQPNCDIYVSDYSDGSWGPVRKVPGINDPKYWDSQPTIASDGLTLFFASDRPGGYGGIDLYMCKRDLKTGLWSPPKNLGPNINTAGDEKTPFIHSDSETLYFSSTGHFGFGKYDIFYVRQNEKGEWGEPENIGSPINSEDDDTGFLVSGDTKTGYFFSFDEGKVKGRGIGRWDFYGFELYKEARPQEVILTKGQIKKDSIPLAGAIVEIVDMKSKKKSFAVVDSTTGEFMFAQKKNTEVSVTVKKDSIAFNSTVVKVSDKSKFSDPVVVDIKVEEAKKGSSFVINNIYYQTNSADLHEESKVVLEQFAQYLKENPKLKIEISGHTDNVGNEKDNEALSTNRAFTVKETIEKFGVDGHRITAKGYGPHKPIASNDSEDGRARNRRTEFLILEF